MNTLRLYGPFTIDHGPVDHDRGDYESGTYVVVYYHEDSGAGTRNESVRMWWFP
jgi:hypothetical protein